mmetsp:Transcript_3219/g.7039  ORF Transcript_3219/g.7039 Transcript_3219/m.7039 type:complete len:83 (-) Transcript_3219:621-869(-)
MVSTQGDSSFSSIDCTVSFNVATGMQDSVQNKMCVVRSSLRAAVVRESMDRMMRTSFQLGLWDIGIVFDLSHSDRTLSGFLA